MEMDLSGHTSISTPEHRDTTITSRKREASGSAEAGLDSKLKRQAVLVLVMSSLRSVNLFAFRRELLTAPTRKINFVVFEYPPTPPNRSAAVDKHFNTVAKSGGLSLIYYVGC